MLAISRTDSVIGRIILLVNSIITRAGDRIFGDPSGTKCAKNLLNLFTIENKITLSHMVRPIGNTIEICEFIVNIVGIMEIKFIIKIIINRGDKNDAVKFLADNVLISIKIKFIILKNIWLNLELKIIIGAEIAKIGMIHLVLII